MCRASTGATGLPVPLTPDKWDHEADCLLVVGPIHTSGWKGGPN